MAQKQLFLMLMLLSTIFLCIPLPGLSLLSCSKIISTWTMCSILGLLLLQVFLVEWPMLSSKYFCAMASRPSSNALTIVYSYVIFFRSFDDAFQFKYAADLIWHIAAELGWPWAPDKFVDFSTTFTHIGFKWDFSAKIVELLAKKKTKCLD